jgi:hypothetical protein
VSLDPHDTFRTLHAAAVARFPRAAVVRFRYGRAGEFPRKRNYAYCADDPSGPVIVLAPKGKRASAERVLGVLAHEWGHALAFLAGMPEHSERDADTLAEQVFGVQIAYDNDDVQTVGAGTRPRPSRLG